MLQKWFRDALREDQFCSRFCDPEAPVALSKELPSEEWALIITRRRLLALLRPGSNDFLSTKPEDTPSCSRDMWSVIMRLYLGCYVYDDSEAPVWLLCICCEELYLDKLGIYAAAVCSTVWERVARHDRLMTVFPKWIASPAFLVIQEKYAQEKAEGHLFGISYRPDDALVFPRRDTRRRPGPTNCHRLPGDRNLRHHEIQGKGGLA